MVLSFHHVGPRVHPQVITEPPHQTCIFPCERREHGRNIVLDPPRTLKRSHTSHFPPSLFLPHLAFLCSLVLRRPATLAQFLLAVEASARPTVWLPVSLEFLCMVQVPPLYLFPFTQNFYTTYSVFFGLFKKISLKGAAYPENYVIVKCHCCGKSAQKYLYLN